MLLQYAILGNELWPVRVIVKHVCLREALIVVVQLGDVTIGVREARIEVSLFQHHGVLVTIEQLNGTVLITNGHLTRVTDVNRTALTTLCSNFDNTIGTVLTPDGSCGSIFQYSDVQDIFSVHLQQLGKLFISSRCHIEV